METKAKNVVSLFFLFKIVRATIHFFQYMSGSFERVCVWSHPRPEPKKD